MNGFHRDRTAIGLEATGHYWLALYSTLSDNGWTVKVINPMQPDAFRNMYIRKTQTDRMDSFIMAGILRFGRYTETVLADEKLTRLKELSRCRTSLAKTTGSLKRKILAILDRIFPEFAACFSDVLGAAPLALLNEYPSPEELASGGLKKLADLLEKGSRGGHSLKKAQELREKAAQSIGVKRGLDALTFQLKILLEQMKCIDGQVKELDAFIAKIMKGFQITLSIPGIGTMLGGAITGEIGEITRFKTPKQLIAFAGMDPKVTQSGQLAGTENKRSKRGSP